MQSPVRPLALRRRVRHSIRCRVCTAFGLVLVAAFCGLRMAFNAVQPSLVAFVAAFGTAFVQLSAHCSVFLSMQPSDFQCSVRCSRRCSPRYSCLRLGAAFVTAAGAGVCTAFGPTFVSDCTTFGADFCADFGIAGPSVQLTVQRSVPPWMRPWCSRRCSLLCSLRTIGAVF